MNSPVRGRWPLLLIGVVVVGWFGCRWFSAPLPTQAAAPATPKGSAVYDPDPQHLWNRVHEVFRAQIYGAETDPWELDPFLWSSRDYLSSEQGQKPALNVLDEFIAKNGATLIKDPMKRALLQRDLWTLFDSFYPPRWAAAKKNPQMELAARVARILPRLSLTSQEIKKLPNSYAEAVAAKKLPAQRDPQRWEAAFLPNDLWEPKGPWVLLGDDMKLPLALNHVHFFGGRSTFFVFLRLPDGREQTLKFLEELRKRARDAKPPPLPAGAQLALLRHMVLIDDQGKRVTTNVTESLRLRIDQTGFEIQMSRRDFLAGKPSLKAKGPDDRERDYILRLGWNAGEGPSKILRTCSQCHGGGGIDSFLSFRRFRQLHLTPTVPPVLIASTREEEEKWSRAWKTNRYEWGLLQGLIQSSARD